MTAQELEAKLLLMGIKRNSQSPADYKMAWNYVTLGELGMDYEESCAVVRRYANGTLFIRQEIEEIIEKFGIQRFSKDKGGFAAFIKTTKFLDGFVKYPEERKTYMAWIEDYLARPITIEEQEKFDLGEIRFDDI